MTVTAAHDDDADNDTATLLHTASGGDYASVTAHLAVTVEDDDEPVSGEVVLSASPSSVSEGDGTTAVTVTATLDTGARGEATVVTVTVAEDADEYAATPSVFEIEIPADAAGAAASFDLTPVDDADDEPDRRVAITGATAVGLAVRTTSVTIRDDDEPNRPPTFPQTSYTFDLLENVSGRDAPVALGTVAAHDADGDRLRYTLSAGDPDRFTVSPGTGEVSYVGDGEDFESGPPQFDLEVTAGDGRYEAKVQVIVRVVEAPESPEAQDDWAETPEDTPLVVDVLSNDTDPDGDRLRVASVTAPEHGTAAVVSGGVRYAPALNWYGEDRFTYTAADPGGLSSEATVRVTVTPVNDAPEAVDDAAETPEDAAVVVDVLANDTDVDGDRLRVASVTAPEHGTATAVSGGVRYAPALNWYGEDRFTYTAADPGGLSSEATVRVMVTPVNDAPEAVDDAAETPEDVAVVVDVLANDTDADGDRLRVASVTAPEHGTATAVSGGVRYAPALNWHGEDRFTYTAMDPDGLSSEATVRVTVMPVNDAPEAVDDAAETPEDVAVVVDVLANDTDVDGDRLRVASVTAPEHGTATAVSGGVRYAPALNWYGEDRFTYTAMDPGGLSSEATVRVTVTPVNDAPEAVDDAAETPEDVAVVVDVLANDTDVDGDRLRVASVTAPEHGTATAVSGGVRYAPALNWHGEDRFTYTAMDPGGLSSEATVRVTVTPVNDAPEAVDDAAETPEDVAVVVDVLANDTDVDGDRLTVVSAGPAAHGATAIADGGVRYSPSLNWYGTDSFSYTIADPGGLTATATVTMTVLPVNDAPEAVGVIPDQALEEGGGAVTVDLAPYFTDVEGDALSYVAISSDESAVTVAVAGARLTLSPVVTGAATVTVTAADPYGLTAVRTFGVSVGDLLVRDVLTDALAALGRAHLSSARNAIGRRLEYDDGATRLMIGGQQLTPDAWEQMGAGGLEQSHWLSLRAAALRQRRSPQDLSGTSADPRFQRAGLTGGGFGGGAGTDWGRMLLGTDVLLSFGGQGDGETPSAGVGRWRVWGQGDRQSFQWGAEEAAGYEGDLATGYIGVDVQLRERLLAGLAVSRSGGGSEWRQGYSSGRLGTELTVLHPYVRIGGRDTAVWALAGVGRGTAENVRALNGRRGTSPLDLRLGLLEGRHRLGRAAGGVELALRGEASWAELRTGSGEETVDALSAAVRRLRTGVEATLPLGDAGGVQLAPFGAVSTRHDGGAGQTGVGLETAAGVRVSAGRVRVEAQGRRLLLHTASGYEEHGFSVTATVGGGHYEPGLTASVRPHWGAPGYGAESLWQDHVRSYTAGLNRYDGGVDARLGYGWQLPGNRLLTPLVGYGRIGEAQRMQLGARLGVLGRFSGDLATPVEVELLGERYGRPDGGADHRVGLYGIVNFDAPE